MKTIFKYPIVLLFCLLNCLTFTSTYSQNEETKRLLAEIEGTWQKDNNGNVTYTKVIENINLPKDSIYNRVLEYCTINYYYGDKSTIVQDRKKGTIKAKGFYRKTYHHNKPLFSIVRGKSESSTNINTMHKLKIEIKENRVIILLTLTEYDYSLDLTFTSRYKKFPISNTFPVNPKRSKWKNKFGEAFYESHRRVQKSLLDIESAIREVIVEEKKY